MINNCNRPVILNICTITFLKTGTILDTSRKSGNVDILRTKLKILIFLRHLNTPASVNLFISKLLNEFLSLLLLLLIRQWKWNVEKRKCISNTFLITDNCILIIHACGNTRCISLNVNKSPKFVWIYSDIMFNIIQ